MRNVFRFLALRPVEKVRAETEPYRFLHPSNETTALGEAAPSSALQHAISSSGSLPAARALARSHIHSDAYLRGFDSTQPALAFLARVYAAATKALAAGLDEQARQHLEKVLQSRPDQLSDEMLISVRNVVWDSLIAAFLEPKVEPHDRAELVYLLRAIRLVEEMRALESAERVREVLRATPVIPTWAMQGTSAPTGSPTPETGPVPTVPGGIDPKLGQINVLHQKMIAVRRAAADVRSAYATVARDSDSARRSPRESPPRSEPAAPSPDAGTGRRQMRTISDTSAPPWRSSELVARHLQPSTVELLDGIDRSWQLRSPDNALRLLERQEARIYRKLVSMGGERSLARIDDPIDKGDLDPGEFEDLPTIPRDTDPFTHSIVGSVGEVRPIGVGDLLIVREELLGYGETEIAYIENVMKTESRQRVHRRLDRQVETVVSTTEETEETERDLQSTKRYELATEVENTIASDVSIGTGVNVSASYGPMMSVDTSADFAVNNSSETSSVTSTNFAQEVVDKSVSRLSRTIREEITTKTLSETEETNTHGFDNTQGTEHAIGVYRWLDQIWKAQVYNYGKRLMMEFIIPEPAAFYKHARAASLEEGVVLLPPQPLGAAFSFLDVTPARYETWVDRYRVRDVDPPPAEFTVVAKVIDLPVSIPDPKQGDLVIMTKTDTIAIPEGYVALEAWAYGTWTIYTEFEYRIHVHVGRSIFEKEDNDDYKAMNGESGTLPVGVYTFEVAAAMLSVEVRCERTEEALLTWQLETYQKIVDAYNSLQAAYDAQVASVQNAQIGTFTDLPPDKKREIEREELKKGALVLLTDQHFADFGALTEPAAPYDYPEIRPEEALAEGRYVQFFEQCFEWEQLAYFCYPYFWGRKDQWVENSTATDSDPVFEAFLQAGAARVVVPVRPRYEKLLAYYLTFGSIWGGGETPIVNDPLYVSVVDEITESQDVSLDDAVPYGESWTYALPTALIKIQDDATLSASGGANVAPAA